MAGDLKRNKRSRWGADLGEEADPSSEAPGCRAPGDDEPRETSFETSRSTASKRRKSRWGGDKLEASDGGTPVEEQIDGHYGVATDNGLEAARHQPAEWEASAAQAAVPVMQSLSGFSLSFRQPPQAVLSNPSASVNHSNQSAAASIHAAAPGLSAGSLPPAPRDASVAAPGDSESQPLSPGSSAAPGLVVAAQPGTEQPAQGFQAPPGQENGGTSEQSAAQPAQGVGAEILRPDIPEVAMDVGDVAEQPPGTSPERETAALEIDPASLPPPPAFPAPQKATGDSPASAAATAPPPKTEPCTLIVSSIRAEANEQSLRLLFESAGKVVGCKLVKDGDTGGHKGFGFVMMGTRAEAEAAVEKFDKLQWGDKELAVTLKVPGEAAKPAPLPWTSAAASQPGASLPWSAGSVSGALPQPPGTPAAQGMAMPAAGAYGYYDPYAASYGYYGYNYADPYAAYAAAPYAIGQSGEATDASASALEEKPPGVDDEEAPPGMEAALPSGTAAAATAPGEEQPGGGGDADGGEGPAPPPPPPPKKEPTVIHVPLKVPEGARKKQEERKKAREEKAKQLQAEAEAAAESGAVLVDGEKDEGGEKQPQEETAPASAAAKAAVTPQKPVIVGTKGSFQEVLARRQAELAAIKAGKAAASAAKAPPRPAVEQTPPYRPGRPGPGFGGSAPPHRGGFIPRRGRFPGRSASPPPPRSQSPPGRRRPTRRPSPARVPLRSVSRSYSRSPPPKVSRSPNRSRSRSLSGSPRSFGNRSNSQGQHGTMPGSRSPSKQKEKRKSKDKKKEKRKHKKEKRRRTKDAEGWPTDDAAATAQEASALRVGKTTAELGGEPGPRTEIPLPPPSHEPASGPVRKPLRKRAKTRWHPDDDEADEGNDAGGVLREPGERRDRRRRTGEHLGATEGTERPGRKEEKNLSPQVSEEGEIPLEEGEIEGELGELPPEPKRADGWEPYPEFERGDYDPPTAQGDYGPSDYGPYGPFRGRAGGRDRDYGPEGTHRFPDQRRAQW